MFSNIRHWWDAVNNTLFEPCSDPYRIKDRPAYRTAYLSLVNGGSVFQAKDNPELKHFRLAYGFNPTRSALRFDHSGSKLVMVAQATDGDFYMQAIGYDRGLIDGKRIRKIPPDVLECFYAPADIGGQNLLFMHHVSKGLDDGARLLENTLKVMEQHHPRL